MPTIAALLILALSSVAAPKKDKAEVVTCKKPGTSEGCPAEHRCVKEGDRHVCRPIQDGLGL
jgi:hypothetical protein